MSEGDTKQHEEKVNRISKSVLVFAAFAIVILGAGIVVVSVMKTQQIKEDDSLIINEDGGEKFIIDEYSNEKSGNPIIYGV